VAQSQTSRAVLRRRIKAFGRYRGDLATTIACWGLNLFEIALVRSVYHLLQQNYSLESVADADDGPRRSRPPFHQRRPGLYPLASTELGWTDHFASIAPAIDRQHRRFFP